MGLATWTVLAMSKAGKFFLLVVTLLCALACGWRLALATVAPARAGSPAAVVAPMLAAVAPEEPGSAMAAPQVSPTSANPPPASPQAVSPPVPPPSQAAAARAAKLERTEKPVTADRPARREYAAVRMLVTAYCPCRKCCGESADGVTASGRPVTANDSRFVAADAKVLSFGRLVSVPGYHGGQKAPVLDRGGLIKGKRLDVFFPTHAQAQRWGARWLDVKVYRD